MAQRLAPYTDAEAVVLSLLAELAPTVTQLPDDITHPVIQVQRVGGVDDGHTDFPRIEVQVFAPTRREAWALSLRAQQVVLAAARTVVDGALIDGAETVTPAQQVPYGNPDTRRVLATYELALRRPAQQ